MLRFLFFSLFFSFFSFSFSLSSIIFVYSTSQHSFINSLLLTLSLSFITSSSSIALTMMEKKKIKEVSKEKKSDDDDYHHHHRERIESWRRNLVFLSFDDDVEDDDDLKGEGEITKMITQRKRRAYAKLRGEFFSSSSSSSENNNNACDSSSSSSSSPKLSAMKTQNFSHMFQKKELVRVVTQDVRRIVFAEKKGFGGKKFWQSPDVRAALIRMLTVFVLEKEMESSRKSSGDVKIEYKQGMHEIVAMVYLATCRAAGGRRFDDDDGENEDDNNDEDDDEDDDEENYDALLDASLVVARDDDDDDDDDFYSQKFVEHDCYALFSAFVNNTKSSLRLLDYFQSQNESFIDEYCLRFFNKMHAVDEETARIFFSKMSLTRLYLPRFLKLAYVRECKRGEFLLMIWDSIIAEMGREGRKHSSNYPSVTKDREESGEAVQHHHHQSSYGSAREFFESLSVAAVLRCCKDTITRDESLHQSNDESIGNIINKINAHSFEFSKPSDVDIFIQTAKRVAFEKKIEENEEEDEDEEERYLFDESVFKSNLFSAMEIRDDYVSSSLQ